VIVDHRPQLDLLDLDDLLFLAGFGGFFLGGIFELPVIHDLANGRIGIRRNLDQIHAGFHRHLHGRGRFDGAVVQPGLIDQLDFVVADFIVGARPVFGCSGRGSIGTANGGFSKVVNEGDSLKELVAAGKQTRVRARENHQIRDILVTLVTRAIRSGRDCSPT